MKKFIDEGPVVPNKHRSKCPAIIFADNRMANVLGRIIFLIVSIITINDISKFGVPRGTKWANIKLGFLNQPNIIILIQIVIDNGNVIIKCLVGVKI